LLAGAIWNSGLLILIGIPLVGLTYGGAPTLTAATIGKLYGNGFFPIIYGAATFSIALSAILGPILSSKLQEASGGGYHSTFVMMIIVGAIALILHFLALYFSRKENLE
jgi:MFS family permease